MFAVVTSVRVVVVLVVVVVVVVVVAELAVSVVIIVSFEGAKPVVAVMGTDVAVTDKVDDDDAGDIFSCGLTGSRICVKVRVERGMVRLGGINTFAR